MTTRATFRAMVRETLTDQTQWPDITLNAWLNDAIRDYSQNFPRQVETTIACVAATRSYSLAALAGIVGVLRVEYPTGEAQPRYLVRRSEASSFVDLPVYDVRGDPPATLVIGESPSAGESIGLTYSAEHTVPTTDATALTIPDRHLESLKLFMIWQAIRELELNESQDPDKSSLLLSMLGLNAYRAERAYRSKIQDYEKEASAPGGYSGPWASDSYDRIY